MSNVKIQLETGYLDVKEGSAFPLNYGVADIRDISKRSGTTSKTLTLSGTKNNHELLGHYYDVNVQEGTFNINTLTPCIVLQNDLPILENCYIQLLAVNKKQASVDYEIDVEYEVMVKDAQADFFTKIDNSELTDIDFSDLDHTVTAANVVTAFGNTVTDGYKYILPYSADNIYPLNEFRPAIFAKTYFDRIFESAGFQYTWSTLTDAHFDKLVIPYNGDTINYDYTDYNVEETNVLTHNNTESAGQWLNSTSPLAIINFTEVTDNQNLFNNVLGSYTVPFIITGSDSITFTFDLDYDLNIVNSTGATAYLVDQQAAGGSIKTYTTRPIIYAYVNATQTLYQTNLQLGSYNFSEGTSVANGTTTVQNNQSATASIPIGNLAAGDVITFYTKVLITCNVTGANRPYWKNSSLPAGANVAVNMQWDITALNLKAAVSTSTLASGTNLEVNRYVPSKIKQKDFIKSIFTMYNLYTEINPSEPNILILKHRDDYYDAGAEIDWTYKLAKEREQNLQFLPELSNKKLVLTYKQDTDEPNKVYYDSLREVYGQVEYTFDNEYVKGVDTKELLFSPTPVTQTVFDAYTPMLYGYAPKTNIRILQDGGTGTCQSYNIYDYGTTGQTGLTSYPIIGHWDDPINPTFDINFQTCDYYYYDGYNPTYNSLYNLYWRRTISQINTGKMLTAFFDLDEYDIQRLKLNDKIRIDNSWWHINKVIDYDPNVKQLTKVELMSVDNEIDFAPFKKKPKNFKLTRSEINNAIRDIIEGRNKNSNVYGQGADVIIKGVNNVAMPSVRGFIEGDNNILYEDGIITSRMNTTSTTSGTENFANTDLTFDANRSHDTAGYNFKLTTDAGVGSEALISLTPSTANIKYNSRGLTVDSDASNFTGAIKYTILDINAVYTIDLDDYIINCTANTFTVTLPTSAGMNGLTYIIKNSGSGVITVDGDGTETIDGALTQILNQYESITVVSDGTNWIII